MKGLHSDLAQQILSRICSPKPYIAMSLGVGAGMVLAFHFRSEGLKVATNPVRFTIVWADYTVPACAQVGAFAGVAGWVGIEWFDSWSRRQQNQRSRSTSLTPFSVYRPAINPAYVEEMVETHFQVDESPEVIPEAPPQYQLENPWESAKNDAPQVD